MNRLQLLTGCASSHRSGQCCTRQWQPHVSCWSLLSWLVTELDLLLLLLSPWVPAWCEPLTSSPAMRLFIGSPLPTIISDKNLAMLAEPYTSLCTATKSAWAYFVESANPFLHSRAQVCTLLVREGFGSFSPLALRRICSDASMFRSFNNTYLQHDDTALNRVSHCVGKVRTRQKKLFGICQHTHNMIARL